MSEDNNDVKANHGNIAPILIQDEMRSCYLDYAMSVIVGRALPDVRDGLKPVHRRILYAMHMMGNVHNKPFLKSARVVGDVIGKYHPHGDSAVYNAIVRLAQDFSMRYVVVDGQGNFGSIDGDNAAAMRYTEIRMKKLAEELLKDIDKETVDWQPNYDDSLEEPVVLPTKIPNLLINGSTGIAVGMSTNVPPHNLGEVMSALIELIDDPQLPIETIMNIIPGPDFPTAGEIHGTSGIRKAYLTGKGIIQMRAKAEIEVYGKQDRERIVISELPYQVNKAKLIERIAAMVNDKEIEGISDIRDESNRLGMRIAIEIKRGEASNIILNRLFKQTQLQSSFGIIFLAIHNGQPKVMNIKEQLVYFIDHRKEIIVRRTQYELKKAKERAHILEGLKIAVENIDQVVELIKKSDGPKEAKAKLMSVYSLSDIQSQAILDMRLQRLTGLERDKIIADYEEIMKRIKYLEEILESDELVRGIIRDEFLEIKENYSDARRTVIVGSSEDIDIEDMITDEEVIVTITQKGYIKRMGTDTYKAQKRGGKGVKGGVADEDFVTHLFTASTLDRLMFFTDKGTVFSLKVYQIPEGSRTTKGRNVINLLSIPAGETVKEIIAFPRDITGKYLLIATKQGYVKKTDLSEYERINQNGKKGIKIEEDDSVVNVRVTEGNQEVLICATSGKIVRFDEDHCRPLGRVSRGVRGITLNKDEHVIGMEITNDSMELLCITENGYGKRTQVEEYRKTSRGGKGVIAMKLTEKNGNIVQIKPVSEQEDLMIVTDKGQVIRIKIAGISLIGRNTQGVRLINLKENEKVVAVEKLVEEDDQPEE